MEEGREGRESLTPTEIQRGERGEGEGGGFNRRKALGGEGTRGDGGGDERGWKRGEREGKRGEREGRALRLLKYKEGGRGGRRETREEGFQ